MLRGQRRAWLNIGTGVSLSLVVLWIVRSVGPDFGRLMSWDEWQPAAHWIDVACLLAAKVAFWLKQ